MRTLPGCGRRDFLFGIPEPEHREEDIHTEGQPGMEYQRLSGLRVMSVWGEWPSVRGQSHERMVKTYLQKGTEYQSSAA